MRATVTDLEVVEPATKNGSNSSATGNRRNHENSFYLACDRKGKIESNWLVCTQMVRPVNRRALPYSQRVGMRTENVQI